MKKKKYIQNGEQKFIDGVVEAVLQRECSLKHILVEDKGLLNYLTYPAEEKIDDIERSDGRSVKILCVFEKELIENFHYKALNDDLSKPWVQKAVKHVISIGKAKAKEIY